MNASRCGDADHAEAVAASVQMWNQGISRYIFPSFWLLYLWQAVDGVTKYTDGAASVVGYGIVAAFAASYLVALIGGMSHHLTRFWLGYAAGVALTVLACFFAHEDALVCLVYTSVLTMATQRRWAPLVVAGYAVFVVFLPPAVPSWHTGIAWDLGVTLLLVALAMFGFFKIIASNRELALARAEVARLAAENERSRIARDLHDLLGHSLTTITVKAGLARKLAERGDDERALAEIADVEQLTRRTLGDVRAAVSAHRETTLAGELATAREVLRASDIDAELPPTVVEVDPVLDELFAWVVREAVTNVVRHSRARHVRVTLRPRSLEVVDDGRGGQPDHGNGLRGLTERVAATGGTLRTQSSSSGFALRVDVPEPVAQQPADELPAATRA